MGWVGLGEEKWTHAHLWRHTPYHGRLNVHHHHHRHTLEDEART